MEENRKNKSNTVLLTVIAVATLLVAVIGATFAYFTAIISNAETSSTVVVTSANLQITFADGGSELLTSESVEPTKPTVTGVAPNQTTTYAPLIVKSFTIAGTNTTGQGTTVANSGMRMPYDLYLILTKNEFALQNTNTGTSLSYILTNDAPSQEGSIPSTTTGKYAQIPTTCTLGTEGDYGKTTCAGTDKVYNDYAAGTHDALQTSTQTAWLETIDLYDGNGTAAIANGSGLTGITLGHGYFPAGSVGTGDNANVHSYTLRIYFLEDNKNQDFDKHREFSGYVAISAGDSDTAISSTATAVNTGHEFTFPTN